MLSHLRLAMPSINSSLLNSHMVAALKCQLSTSMTGSSGLTWTEVIRIRERLCNCLPGMAQLEISELVIAAWAGLLQARCRPATCTPGGHGRSAQHLLPLSCQIVHPDSVDIVAAERSRMFVGVLAHSEEPEQQPGNRVQQLPQ